MAPPVRYPSPVRTVHPVSLVVFDLDGTLADTLTDISASMNRVLATLDLAPLPESDYRQYVGEGVRRLVEQALTHRPDVWDEAVTRFRADYDDNLVVESRPYDGVPELLAELARRDLPAAILSNKPHAMTRRVVDALFPGVAFTEVVGFRPEVCPRKPDPSSALAIAANAGVDPEQCVFVGDTHVDVETALAARMTPIGVNWGFRSRAELAERGARAVLDRPAQLLEHIANH